MSEANPEFGIGTIYSTRGKHPRTCTVTEVLRTYDALGKLVCVRYVSIREFAGQMVADINVTSTTIKMGLVKAMPFVGVPMVVGENDYIDNEQQGNPT